MAYKEWIQHYPPYDGALAAISQYFGNGHTGVDSVGNVWDNKVYTIFSGTVTSVRYESTVGNVCEYTSQNKRVRVAYYHLKEVLVKQGQAVAKEQEVGIEGSTGTLATGKHLHTSLWIDGVLTDPLPYLKGQKELPLDQKDEGGDEMVYQPGVYEVTAANGLNVRSEPSTSGKVLGVMAKGTRFTVTAVQKEWGQLAYNGKTGYSSLEFAALVSGCAEQLAATQKELGEVKAELSKVNASLEAANKKIEQALSALQG